MAFNTNNLFTSAHMKKHPLGYMAGGLGPLALGLGASGAFGGGIGNFLTGSSGRVQRSPLFDDQQESALNQLLSQGMSNQNFDAIENRARQQFQTNTIPSIAERFTGMLPGAASSQRSSAFQAALGRAGSDLESQLAALRGQYGLQQTQMGLTPRFENTYMPGQPGLLQGIASMLPALLAFL